MKSCARKRSGFILSLFLCSPAHSIPHPQGSPISVSRETQAYPVDTLQERIAKVRQLSERIDSLKDPFAKVSGLASVGRVACKYDKGFAQEVFLRAYEVTVGAEEDQARLRQALIPVAAQCDAAFAFGLNKKIAEDPGNERSDSSADISSALSLLDLEPQNAAAFAERALRGGSLSEEQRHSLLLFLLKLRQSNAARADTLFLQTLQSLQVVPRVPTMELMHWGNYIFTAKWLLDKGIRDGVTFVRVGTVSVYDLTADRPGVPAHLTRQYLAVALEILSRPPVDAAQRQIDYFALSQFIEKSERFSPDLTPTFVLLRERLEGRLPKAVTQFSSTSALGRSFDEPVGDYLSELERTNDSRRRQTLSFLLASSFWRRKEFGNARKYAQGIDDFKARTNLLELIDWAEIEELADAGKTEIAAQMGGRLSAGLLRSLALAKVAKGWRKFGDEQRASALLYLARKDVERVSNEVRPYLLLALCAVGVEGDATQAIGLLEQTVRAFNELKPAEKPFRPRLITEVLADEDGFTANRWGFTRFIEVSGVRRNFNIRIKDVPNLEFSANLIGEFCAQAERVEAILGELQEEDRRASGWGSLAKCYLERKRREPQP